MKRPGAAARKKVTAENLATLGVERLAELLVSVAETRPDLKRRLRMELAAGQGADQLIPEIDRRLNTLETSRGRVSWRQRPAFARDLSALRDLIGVRLAGMDRGAALARGWRFLDLWPGVSARVRDQAGVVSQPFIDAARDLGRLLGEEDRDEAAAALVGALRQAPLAWSHWLPAALESLPRDTAATALRLAQAAAQATPGWITLLRRLSDAAGDPDAFRATFTEEALRAPPNAAEVARRYLATGRVAEAGDILRKAAPVVDRKGRMAAPDHEWESVWIDYLEAAGETGHAQAVRWASFERSLDPDRARDIISRLSDFEDVEAEQRVFEIAAAHPDVEKALGLLMTWPALPAAATLIVARSDDLDVDPESAELWASRLRRRHPQAAHQLLRRAAALAFRRREYKVCDRLTEEAETIQLP